MYLADLNAIAGANPAWDVYTQLIEYGLNLWVDAGLTGLSSARRLAQWTASGQPLAAVIAGLESLGDAHELPAIVDLIGPERFVFSLDLKASKPLTLAPEWRELEAEAIVARVLDAGVRRLIVLDLAHVGMGMGVGTEALCSRLRQLDSDLKITAGGGVRGPADLASLAASGCDAALVASALHDGRITMSDLAQYGLPSSSQDQTKTGNT